MSLEPSFVVTGNQPVVIRESLLPKAFLMAEGTVASSFELEEGARHDRSLLLGDHRHRPTRVQGVRDLARIVAGSNPFVGGSPCSDINEPFMSTGRRIARSIRLAAEADRLMDILS